MAEAVGLVIGVVSLGVQLAESVQKVKHFYSAVKDAPARLADIIDEIESLSDILTEMEGDRASHKTSVGPKMQRCVATCRKAVDQFSAYADGLESRLRRCKRRGSVKIAMKSDSIEGVISRLESSKSNLMLAYMLYREAVASKRATDMQQQMEAIVIGQALLSHDAKMKPTSPNSRAMDDRVINVHPLARGETRACVTTPLWLSRNIWQLAVSRAISGWTFSLRSYRIIPSCDELASLIRDACVEGDTGVLREMFARRTATPFDEIDYPFIVGWTPTLASLAVLYGRTNTARSIIAASGGHTKIDMRCMVSMWTYGDYDTKIAEIATSRETYRLLSEQCEVDIYDDLATGAYLWGGWKNCAAVEQFRAFLSGSTEEANIAWFWNEMRKLGQWKHNGSLQARGSVSLLLDAAVLNNDYHYLIERPAMSVLNRQGDPMAYTLARTYVECDTDGSQVCKDDAHSLEELIVKALSHGLDLYETSFAGISPLLRILFFTDAWYIGWHDDLSFTAKLLIMEDHLNSWLKLLERVGIDLTLYGQHELSLLQQLLQTCGCAQPLDRRHCRAFPAHPPSGEEADIEPILFTLSYGSSPSDWKLWVQHPGDEYAGQFWQMIEQESLPLEDNDSCQQHMPGGWIATW